MKAKLFMILLTVLFIVPMGEAANKPRKKHAHVSKYVTRRHAATRAPIDYNIDVNDNEDCLQIMFLFPLYDADITVTDKDGNSVLNESLTHSYEGKIIYVYTPEAYPYTLEINSPAVDLTGEIVLEEN